MVALESAFATMAARVIASAGKTITKTASAEGRGKIWRGSSIPSVMSARRADALLMAASLTGGTKQESQNKNRGHLEKKGGSLDVFAVCSLLQAVLKTPLRAS